MAIKKRIRNSLVIGLLGLGIAFQATAQDAADFRLWYDRPASRWVEALPVGNGRLAAMVFGRADTETVQLNEGTLWAGGPNNNLNPEAKSVIPEIRKLLFEGRYLEAQRLTNTKAGPKGNSGMPYQSAGALEILYDHGTGAVEDYYRDLNLEDATAYTRYRIGKTRYTERVFASFTDQVIVIHLTSDGPGKINCRLSLHAELRHTDSVAGGSLYLHGISGDHEGQEGKVRYTTMVRPVLSGGRTRDLDTALQIQGADSATIYVSIATSFQNYHAVDGHDRLKAAEYLKRALVKAYPVALRDHIAAYRKMYDRVRLDLGSTDSVRQPTDLRIARFHDGDDPQLAALYFQFGRYLLISSSEPGGQPATLQGLWNNSIHPPWDSKYTVNINTEMNYWPADKTNLFETVSPLLKMLQELSVTGQESAKARYGARGWVMHHNTDIWRITGVVDGGYYLWPEGGTWLLENLWEHYLYTGDRAFLQQLYPVMKGAAEFFVDELQVEPTHHWLVVSPTMSPEHSYKREDGTEIAVTAGATMDNQLVFDLFSHTIAAAKLLGRNPRFADTLAAKRDSLPPMQVGQYGQLQEWLQDWDNPKDHHRHVSHLYGLFPSNQISPYRTPALFEAAHNSLVYRGDVSTGWSMAWKINLWARLQDGNHALKLLKDQISPAITSSGEHGGTYPNLFDACPPFQIDGNFGCTSGITEMLLQSADGSAFVLPALPDAWKNGSVSGLRARGGFTVDIAWRNHRVSRVTVHSALGGVFRIRSYDALTAGDPSFAAASGTNPNPFFSVPDVKQPIISPKAGLKAPSPARTFLYDLRTRAGKTYTITARP